MAGLITLREQQNKNDKVCPLGSEIPSTLKCVPLLVAHLLNVMQTTWSSLSHKMEQQANKWW